VTKETRSGQHRQGKYGRNAIGPNEYGTTEAKLKKEGLGCEGEKKKEA